MQVCGFVSCDVKVGSRLREKHGRESKETGLTENE